VFLKRVVLSSTKNFYFIFQKVTIFVVVSFAKNRSFYFLEVSGRAVVVQAV
jgi:hypothetical protein